MKSTLQRFEEKYITEPNTGCWLWIGCTMRNGYGKMTVNGKNILAHRFSYETFVGPIAQGLEADHLCGVRQCVNFRHLEVVTHTENLLRGNTSTAANAAKTHCPQRHPYSGENLSLDNGSRKCRRCHRDRERVRRQAASA